MKQLLEPFVPPIPAVTSYSSSSSPPPAPVETPKPSSGGGGSSDSSSSNYVQPPVNDSVVFKSPDQSVTIKIEDKSGNIDTVIVRAGDLTTGSAFWRGLEESGGHLLSMENMNYKSGTGVFFSQPYEPTTPEIETPSIPQVSPIFDPTESYKSEKFVTEGSGPGYSNVPDWVKEQVNLPSELDFITDPARRADVEHRFEEIAYKNYLGLPVDKDVSNVSEMINSLAPKVPVPSQPEQKYEPSVGGFLSFLSTGFKPTFGLTGPTDPDENIKSLRNEMAINEQEYKKMFEEKDIAGIVGKVASGPIGAVATGYSIGAGLGAFSMTKIGSTEVGTVLNRSITPSSTLNAGVGTVFAAETVKGGYEAVKADKLPDFISSLAVAAPLTVIGFNEGYKSGAGAVQRAGAMSTLTNPLERTQQKAVYDMLKINEKIGEPNLSFKNAAYDMGRVETMTPELKAGLGNLFGSTKQKIITKPAIGGSTAMDIQMRDLYRGGDYPERILSIASERQALSSTPAKPLRVGGGPVDVDVLLRGRFASEKAALKLGEELDTHVHISKTNEYLGMGYTSKPSTKGIVDFGEGAMKTDLLSVREQFTRYSISSLPSESKYTSYRSFKDVPGMYDVYDVLRFQKGGSKLTEAMDRYMYPERYQSPKVGLGERFLKRIGGSYEPKYEEILGGKFASPVYPKEIYAPRYPISPGFYGGYSVKPSMPAEYPKSVKPISVVNYPSNIGSGGSSISVPSYPKPSKTIDVSYPKESSYVPKVSVPSYPTGYTPKYNAPSVPSGGSKGGSYPRQTYMPKVNIPSYPTAPVKVPYTPSYKPPRTPSYTPPYRPPTYKPRVSMPKPSTYNPPYRPPNIKVPVSSTNKMVKMHKGDILGSKNLSKFYDDRYLFRQFKLPNLNKIFKKVKF